jgi:hypothetical protein
MAGTRLPNFIVIGAAKSGTTSLYHYLRAHPDVYMSEMKELNYFVAEQDGSIGGRGKETRSKRRVGNWSRGLEWYEHQFAPADGFGAIGEASPRYTLYPFLPGVPERMAQLLPDVKLVYLVRDPIARMVSHCMHRMHSLKERRPLETALMESPIYVNSSRYAFQIEQYLRPFSRSQLHVVVSEHLRSDRDRTLARIFEFIGVDPSWRDQSLSAEHNISAPRRAAPRGVTRAAMSTRWWKPMATALPASPKRIGRRISHRPVETEISPELRLRLAGLVREDVAELRHYMDDSFDGWGIA